MPKEGSGPGEGRGGNTQRLCEKRPQRQGWQLHEEWCGPWNLLAEVARLPGVESEGGGAHQSRELHNPSSGVRHRESSTGPQPRAVINLKAAGGWNRN